MLCNVVTKGPEPHNYPMLARTCAVVDWKRDEGFRLSRQGHQHATRDVSIGYGFANGAKPNSFQPTNQDALGDFLTLSMAGTREARL